MKRMISVFLVLLVTISLTACGSTTGVKKTSTTSQSSPAVSASIAEDAVEITAQSEPTTEVSSAPAQSIDSSGDILDDIGKNPFENTTYGYVFPKIGDNVEFDRIEVVSRETFVSDGNNFTFPDWYEWYDHFKINNKNLDQVEANCERKYESYLNTGSDYNNESAVAIAREGEYDQNVLAFNNGHIAFDREGHLIFQESPEGYDVVTIVVNIEPGELIYRADIGRLDEEYWLDLVDGMDLSSSTVQTIDAVENYFACLQRSWDSENASAGRRIYFNAADIPINGEYTVYCFCTKKSKKAEYFEMADIPYAYLNH